VTGAVPEQTPGYVLTRFADKYGRAVAFAFAGARRGRAVDGGNVYLDAAGVRRSANFRLLAAGMAYPTFYVKLYVDLRNAMASAAVAARNAGTGVWADDATLGGFTLRSREQLADKLVILPKLYRRLADYLVLDDTGGVDLAGFSGFLAARDDPLFTLPDGLATNLDTLVQVRRQTVHLTVPPEQIVFLET
jgi:hypothetical protein